MTHLEASVALGTTEQAHQKAVAEAAARRREFEADPSEKAHARMVISEQCARNMMASVEAGRAAVKEARRAQIGEALADARARASLQNLIEETAPDCASLVARVTGALPEVARIESAIRKQNDASEEATDHAAALGVHPDADPPVSMDLLRAVVGVTIAQWLVDNDVTVPHARGFYRYFEPRWDRGSGAPDVELIRQARALVIADDAFDVRASVDFHHDASDIAPWETTPDDRPKRWEV